MSAKSNSGSARFPEALANRRSYYNLTRQSPISDQQIQSIVQEVMLKTPSAFNSQSTRAVLLLKSGHEQFWDIVKEVLLNKIGPERFHNSTGPKLDGFRGAYGTVLFYEDQPTISEFKEKYPSYADSFGDWSEHTSGMHQFAVWTALEAEGFGANLQHYNPIADEKTAAAFGLPSTWKLRAQLVFGTPHGDEPEPKEKKPISELLRVVGAENA